MVIPSLLKSRLVFLDCHCFQDLTYADNNKWSPKNLPLLSFELFGSVVKLDVIGYLKELADELKHLKVKLSIQ